MLQLCEFGSCKVVQRRILLRFPVETDIESHKRVNPAGFHFLLIAPFAIGNNELSELRAPVAEMIYPDAVPAGEGIEHFQRMPDDRRAEMPDVEGLCNVWRGVVDNKRPALAGAVLSVIIARRDYLRNGVGRKRNGINAEIEIASGGRNLRKALRKRKSVPDFPGNDRRGFSHCPAEPEAGKSNVAHRPVGRVFKHILKLPGRGCAVLHKLRKRGVYRFSRGCFEFYHCKRKPPLCSVEGKRLCIALKHNYILFYYF